MCYKRSFSPALIWRSDNHWLVKKGEEGAEAWLAYYSMWGNGMSHQIVAGIMQKVLVTWPVQVQAGDSDWPSQE